MHAPSRSRDCRRHGAHRFPSLPADLMMDGFNHPLAVIVPSCRAVISRLGATVDHSRDTERFVADVMAGLPGSAGPATTTTAR
ncbi:beta-lactamase [Burkholderia lata]|uniref:Beta-lactamase n=1 Tax=Burkholderia lata (strain ATCC 17760 / DSM 23089 / LMG 22485 / NCIMB 9086 / R18194 / 383) TaxID=482957 RepID=A0A6P2NAM8_BURL3|nr:hypothetical protein [Burkholderia lata]VWB89589.1 beta-lactamase [Burkholderia lata]